MPAGFTPDGLPVGAEFVGGPFTEADLLKLGAAFERATRARRPPASTPPLPGPAGQFHRLRRRRHQAPQSAPAIRATFRQSSPNVLSFDVTIDGANAQDVIVVALQRTPPPRHGRGSGSPAAGASFVIARLLRSGELSGRGDVTLRDADRDDLAAGRLQVRLFTRQKPLGDAMLPVVLDK